MFCSFNAGTGEGLPVSSLVTMSMASGTMRILHTFDTSGTVLDARGFASNTYTFPFSIAYCMFIRPFTCISSAIFSYILLIVFTFSSEIFLEGIIHAESPECTPASSICSITAGTKCMCAVADRVCFTFCCMTEETVDQNRTVRCHTDCCRHISYHAFRIIHNFHATAAQYVRRTHHNRITDLLGNLKCLIHIVTAIPDSGIGISSLSIIARNRSRSSARSITDGAVPRSSRRFSRSAARFSGVCPPNCAITLQRLFLSYKCTVHLPVSAAQNKVYRKYIVCRYCFRVTVYDDRLKTQLFSVP